MARDLAEMFDRASEGSIYFRDILARMKALMPQEWEKAKDPVVVAQVVHEALTAAKPKAAYWVKPDPRRVVLEWLPTRWADALMKKMLSG